MKYFKLVKIDSKYCDYLRQFDNKVPYNKDKKELRPFIGVLFCINNCEFFAPLTSPKPKHLKMHNSLDFYKIDDGKLGAINFNNMIPVKPNNYEYIDLEADYISKSDKSYKNLIKDQLEWLNEHGNIIRKNSKILYNLKIKNNLKKNIDERCCNFKLLEEKCAEYNSLSV